MTRPKNTSADFRYDTEAAERAVGFFRDVLVHAKGELAGTPLLLAPWQADGIVRPMFGWKRPDGSRRYRTAFVMVPRKAGKSTLAAGLALYELFCGEPTGEIYGAAADRQQAGIILEMAKTMVAASPALRSRAKVYARSIVVPATGNAYRVVSADAYSAHGLNPSMIVFDELHVQPNRELWDALTTGTGARRQALTVAITTAGYERTSLCYELYDHARKVQAGTIVDDAFLPVIHAADPEDDWTLPATWRKAHPGIGISVPESFIASECERARQMPSYENTFKRLMLNLWTEQATRWLSCEQWDKCEGELPDLAGAECCLGLDLSNTTDVSALLMAFAKGKHVYLKAKFWCPLTGVRRRSLTDAVPYQTWIDGGLIQATPGPTIDYDFIRAEINALAEQFTIGKIAYDPWNASGLVKQLTDDGFNMVPVRQGFVSMNAPTKEFERRVLAGEIVHDGNAVLRWMVDNVAVDTDAAGNLKPAKDKSSDRIDGVVAAILALSQIGQEEPPFEPGVWVFDMPR